MSREEAIYWILAREQCVEYPRKWKQSSPREDERIEGKMVLKRGPSGQAKGDPVLKAHTAHV